MACQLPNLAETVTEIVGRPVDPAAGRGTVDLFLQQVAQPPRRQVRTAKFDPAERLPHQALPSSR